MEVSLHETPGFLIPCHHNCAIWQTVQLNHSSKDWTHFLKTIPDEPQRPGYTYMRRAESNSLIHMTPPTTAQHTSMSEELDNMPQTTHGRLGTAPGNHRQPSTMSQTIQLLTNGLHDGERLERVERQSAQWPDDRVNSLENVERDGSDTATVLAHRNPTEQTNILAERVSLSSKPTEGPATLELNRDIYCFVSSLDL